MEHERIAEQYDEEHGATELSIREEAEPVRGAQAGSWKTYGDLALNLTQRAAGPWPQRPAAPPPQWTPSDERDA
jgi:hypothetical protein